MEALHQQAAWIYRSVPEASAPRPAWFEQEVIARRTEEDLRIKEMKAMFDRVQQLERENAYLKATGGFRTPSRFSTPEDHRVEAGERKGSKAEPSQVERSTKEAETPMTKVQATLREAATNFEELRTSKETEVVHPPRRLKDPPRRLKDPVRRLIDHQRKPKDPLRNQKDHERLKHLPTKDLNQVTAVHRTCRPCSKAWWSWWKACSWCSRRSSTSERLRRWRSWRVQLQTCRSLRIGRRIPHPWTWRTGSWPLSQPWVTCLMVLSSGGMACFAPPEAGMRSIKKRPHLRRWAMCRSYPRSSMAAIPASQQEEVIAGKDVSTMNVLAKLMLSYQPGGLNQNTILTALDSPEEAQTLSQAVTGLRKWLRWHRRAGEVGVVRPDATIQVKGLGRLMKKVLKDNADLAFRIQLAKSSLQIDTTPTESSVMTYANHLLAEVEQIAHQDQKKKEEKLSSPDQKLKRIGEEAKGEGKGGRAEKSTTRRFFCTEDGCRKGRSCSWSHVLDDKKRCWNCGSSHHFSPSCERPRDPPKEGGEKGGKAEGKGQKAIGEVAEPIAPTESAKGLLEEANKTLKSLTVKGGSEEEKTKDERLEAMQVQLDEMRKIKVLRVSRISRQEVKYGLLDSGATHPMRGKKEMEDLKHCDEVKVSLANGSQATMHMTSKGVMVVDDSEVEPIVPLSYVVQKLGYNLSWSGEKMQLKHLGRPTSKSRWSTDVLKSPRRWH